MAKTSQNIYFYIFFQQDSEAVWNFWSNVITSYLKNFNFHLKSFTKGMPPLEKGAEHWRVGVHFFMLWAKVDAVW